MNEVIEPIDNGQEITPQPSSKWYESLGEGLRDNPSITKFNDISSLAKSYIELQSSLGRDKVIIPKDENDVDAWAKLAKAWGVPEEYDIKAPEYITPDGLEEFKKFAKEAKLTGKQAQQAFDTYINAINQAVSKQAEQQQKEYESAVSDLRKEFGVAFNAKIKDAQLAIKHFCGDDQELFSVINDKLGNNPKFVKAMSKYAEKFQEGKIGDISTVKATGVLTPQEARAKIDEIKRDYNHPYWAGVMNKRDDVNYCQQHGLSPVSEKERKAAVSYVNSLEEMARQAK